jgi:hypothetical protein
MSIRKHSEEQIIDALKQAEGGTNGGRGRARTGREQAHELSLEGEVRRAGGQRSAASATTGRREPTAEEAGGGSEPGQGHVAGGDPKERLELVGIRSEVGYLRSTFGPSERRACVLLVIAVSSYGSRSER